MIARRHAWESDDAENAPIADAHPHAWEAEADDDSSSGSDSEGEELSLGQEFVEYMTDLFFARTLSAQQLCIALWHAAQFVTDEAQLHAFPPGSPTGHDMRHLHSTMPLLRETHKLCKFPIPTNNQNDGCRADAHIARTACP